ncbi:LPXTG cell wall anchor domain-containing protein [Micromonospora halophytica]|uniref:LPXTG-motif cell wall anchor domain-containing protein n=1 Tax=Micromonospora halophytica TaxID=47864 RepID=A0A1C5HZQ6_9ACTN|nr:LPXTG cell wall anchor domain-containing protein [Micromonospora halophytica]SCG51478.1 LPXTG-motif cell wall anchor domain-containing protein [Micromonospora halophytica]
MPQRRHVARAAFSAAAATACLALATPAWASSTIPLHTDHKGSTAADFPTQICGDERFEGRAANQDGWHFVLPGGKESGSFETLTLTYTDGITEVEIKVPDASDAYPDFLYSAGGQDSRVIHAYVFTPAGWTLVDGSAMISGEAEKFNLSHTCPGTPSQSPSPTPSTTASPSPSTSTSPTPGESNTPSESTSPSASTGGSGGSDGELPLTGVATTGIAVTGLVLIGGGVALTALRRRRDRITFTS